MSIDFKKYLPKLQPWLDRLQNYMHIPIACAFQAAILLWHCHTGKDLGPNVQGTVFSFYALLGGHFVGSQVWPDKTTQAPTTIVNVDNDNSNTATATAAPAAVPDPSKG
jgi:hypothetical protein